jgi:UDP-N-acetylmuramate--alanine ligase
LVVVFQPHRYSRTLALYDRFAICFNEADVLVLVPVYPAGEPPLEGVTAEWLVRGIREHGHREVIHCPQKERAVPTLLSILRPGDVVLTLGAGDIYQVGEELLKKLRAKRKSKKKTTGTVSEKR